MLSCPSPRIVTSSAAAYIHTIHPYYTHWRLPPGIAAPSARHCEEVLRPGSQDRRRGKHCTVAHAQKRPPGPPSRPVQCRGAHWRTSSCSGRVDRSTNFFLWRENVDCQGTAGQDFGCRCGHGPRIKDKKRCSGVGDDLCHTNANFFPSVGMTCHRSTQESSGISTRHEGECRRRHQNINLWLKI